MENEQNTRRELIGPQLPFTRSQDSDSEEDSSDDAYGPALPPPTTETREEWMTSASDAVSASVGLHVNVASSFKKKDDDEAYKKAMAKRDAELLEVVEEYNREKRPISLIEMHRNKKKMKKSEPECEERKPFDREEELKVRRMDSRQTSSIINNAKFLDSRFSAGTQRFL